MSGKHNFQTLKNHATKEYKFKQEYSIGAFRPGNSLMGDSINALELSQDEFDEIKQGVCSALAAAWIKEWLTSSQRRQFTGDVPGDLHLTRNRDAVAEAVPQYRAFKKAWPRGTMLDQYGLKRTSKNPPGVMVTEFSPANSNPVPIPAPSLARACSGTFLKPGRAVFVQFSVSPLPPRKNSGRHAVAAARDDRGKLHFFDSNCGVYKVTEEPKFFEEYVQCYAGIKYKIWFDERSGNTDGFTYVDG